MVEREFLRRLRRYLDKRTKPNRDISIALRYLPIVEKICRFPPAVKILEVGSGEYGILPYLDNRYRITGVDIDFGSKSQSRMKAVKTSGSQLPFTDSSFDITLSVDTLEHLPEDMRRKALLEMVRVTRHSLYLAFPSGWAARWSDEILFRYYRFTHKENFPFLEEHRKYVLPGSERVIGYLNQAMTRYKKPGSIREFGNTNFLLWIGLLLLGFSQVGFLTSIYRWLSLATRPLSWLRIPPYYRKVIVVDFKSKP